MENPIQMNDLWVPLFEETSRYPTVNIRTAMDIRPRQGRGSICDKSGPKSLLGPDTSDGKPKKSKNIQGAWVKWGLTFWSQMVVLMVETWLSWRFCSRSRPLILQGTAYFKDNPGNMGTPASRQFMTHIQPTNRPYMNIVVCIMCCIYIYSIL